ncbi:MAG: hypothetical protein NTU51_10530 [Bacteroidetes bacterium]|nr:hypothetical protein [Bacteroidota bacterium]
MNAAYDAYKAGHESLFSAKTNDQVYDHARLTVENYLNNRLIWDELNYFKKNNQILGHHPIFSWMHRVDEIRRLKIGDLVNLKIRLENNLVRNRAAVRRSPNHPETGKRKDRIAQMQHELSEVNRLLNI